MVKGLEYVISLTDKISAPVKAIKSNFDKLATGAKVVAGIGAAFSAATVAVTAFVDKNLTALDEIHQLSNVTGAGAKSIYLLGKMAEVNGSSVEAAQASIEGLSKVIGEAAQGAGKGAKAFQLYGLSAKDSNGNVKSTMQVLDDIHKRMHGLSEQEQIAMLSKLGIDKSMIQLLRVSGSELTEMAKRADALSLGVATPENAATAATFKDTMTELGQVVTGFGEYISVGLAPIITRLVQGFNDWYVANNALIKNALNKLISGIDFLLTGFFKVISTVNNVISSTIGWEGAMASLVGLFIYAKAAIFGTFLKSLPMLFAKVGSVLFSSLIAPLKVFVIYAKSALLGLKVGFGLLFSPIGLIAVGIIAVIAVVIKFREQFKAFFEGVLRGFAAWGLSFEPIKNALGRVWELFGKLWTTISGLFAPIQASTEMTQQFASAGEFVGFVFGAALELIVNAITFVINAFGNLLAFVIDVITSISTGWSEFINLLTAGEWAAAFGQLWDGIVGIVSNVWHNVKTSAIEFINGLISIINKFGASIDPIELPVKTSVETTALSPVSATVQAASTVGNVAALQPQPNAQGKVHQIEALSPRTQDLDNHKGVKGAMNQTNNNQKTFNVTINAPNSDPKAIANAMREAETKELQ